jgi:membrane-bound lytic murein transglycosylase B
MRGFLLTLAIFWASAAYCAPPFDRPYGKRDDVDRFISDMVGRHGFVEKELRFLFSRARREAPVLEAIVPQKDPKARSWQLYRARFVDETRIAEGAEFARRHAKTLARAEEEHGVPEEIIVAILGIETLYGRQMGVWRVIDALSTLAFDYPPRADFFRSELEQFLLFARETGIDVFSVRGSYAGAIGIPQFMPGSYRRFAVDFDGDGVANLRLSAPDAIGSVANFLAMHGWRRGERVELAARVSGEGYKKLLEAGTEPTTPLGGLKGFGIETRSDLSLDTPVALIELENADAPAEYRIGLRNFYVLTRYNRSVLYASAVVDLAQEIRQRRHAGGR